MGVVLLLMTIGGTVVAAVLLAISYLTKKPRLKFFVFGGLTTWFFGYLFLLFVGSFFSVERTLDLNEQKEFCGFYFDCHLHAGVAGVRTARRIGGQTAQGKFVIVNVEVSSDARSEPLNLIDPEFVLEDEGGRLYARREAAEKELDSANISFARKVAPNQNFQKEIVFDVTEPTDNFKLSVTDTHGVDKVLEAVLIGDEDSLFHKPTDFKIETNPQTMDK